MFATIKHLIPEPRQVEQPRRYTGRHRRVDELDLMPADDTIVAAAPPAASPAADRPPTPDA